MSRSVEGKSMKNHLIILLLVAISLNAEDQPKKGWFSSKVVSTVQGIAEVKKYFEDHGAGKQAIKDLEEFKKNDQSNKERLEKAANAINEVASATNNVADTHKETNEILKDGIEKIQAESRIKDTIAIIGAASGIVYIVKSTYDGFNLVYHYFYPTQESLLKEQRIARELKLLKAEMALNECLGKNMRSPLGEDGMPVNCSQAAHDFIQAAGSDQYNKIKTAFAQCR